MLDTDSTSNDFRIQHFCVDYLGADILGEVLEQELVLLAEALLSHSHRDVYKNIRTELEMDKVKWSVSAG